MHSKAFLSSLSGKMAKDNT